MVEIRTKVVVLVDCPKCNTKIKLSEQITDDNLAHGEVLIVDEED